MNACELTVYQGDLAKICIRKQVLLLKTLSEQLNAIPMGLLPQKSCVENIKQNLEHLRKQAILLKIHSRQLNVIPMGFSRQKFCIENPYSKYQTKSRAPTRKQVMLFKLLKTLSEQLKYIKESKRK